MEEGLIFFVEDFFGEGVLLCGYQSVAGRLRSMEGDFNPVDSVFFQPHTSESFRIRCDQSHDEKSNKKQRKIKSQKRKI